MLTNRFYVVLSISLFPYFLISLFLPSFFFLVLVFLSIYFSWQFGTPADLVLSEILKE